MSTELKWLIYERKTLLKYRHLKFIESALVQVENTMAYEAQRLQDRRDKKEYKKNRKKKK